MVELDRGGLLASCTLGCAGLLAPPGPETPPGIAAELIFPAAFPLTPQLARRPPLPWSLPARPEAPGAGAEGSHIQDSAPLCRCRGSLVPTTATVVSWPCSHPQPSLGRRCLCSCLCFQRGWGVSRELVPAAGGTVPGCERGLLLLCLTGSEAALGMLSHSSHWLRAAAGICAGLSRDLPGTGELLLGFLVCCVVAAPAWSLPLRAQPLCFSKG